MRFIHRGISFWVFLACTIRAAFIPSSEVKPGPSAGEDTSLGLPLNPDTRPSVNVDDADKGFYYVPGDQLAHTWLALITAQWRTPRIEIIESARDFHDVTYPIFHINVAIRPDGEQRARLNSQVLAWAVIDAMDDIFADAPMDQPSPAGTPKAPWSVPVYNIHAYDSFLGQFTSIKDAPDANDASNQVQPDVHYTGQQMSMKPIIVALFGMCEQFWRFKFDEEVAQTYPAGTSIYHTDPESGYAIQVSFWSLGSQTNPIKWLELVDGLRVAVYDSILTNHWESADVVVSTPELLAYLNVRWCIPVAGAPECPGRTPRMDTRLTSREWHG